MRCGEKSAFLLLYSCTNENVYSHLLGCSVNRLLNFVGKKSASNNKTHWLVFADTSGWRAWIFCLDKNMARRQGLDGRRTHNVKNTNFTSGRHQSYPKIAQILLVHQLVLGRLTKKNKSSHEHYVFSIRWSNIEKNTH